MQHLKLTNHPLSDLEITFSYSEYEFIEKAINLAAKELGYPDAIAQDDKEFIKTIFAKLHLHKQLNTDNTQQFKDVYALEHARALNKKEATNEHSAK